MTADGRANVSGLPCIGHGGTDMPVLARARSRAQHVCVLRLGSWSTPCRPPCAHLARRGCPSVPAFTYTRSQTEIMRSAGIQIAGRDVVMATSDGAPPHDRCGDVASRGWLEGAEACKPR